MRRSAPHMEIPPRWYLAPCAWHMGPPRRSLPFPLTLVPERCGPSIRPGMGGRAEASTSSRAVRRARGKQHTACKMCPTPQV
eukprot:1545850-Pyramimonas_sp.AAC.1